MNYILKILLSAIAVFVLSNIVPGISIENYTTAILVAIVLGLLNTLIRPLLIFFTIPLTIITLGLFLLVINAAMVLLSDYFINGFNVSGLFPAILFSILLSLTQSIFYKLLDNTKKTH
ncbi:MAG: phage holin family protein [Flavobacteriaceae bacterium]